VGMIKQYHKSKGKSYISMILELDFKLNDSY
jgi:hypothetical protein